MPENRGYLPEGLSAPPLYTLEMLRRAVSDDTVLEGTVQRCDGDLNLYLQLGSTFAKIPREEVTAPWISGADREIAVLSRVGKQVCFTVESLSADAKGAPTALLSRRKVQEQAMEEMRRGLKPGAVVVGKVVRMEPFGAFVDIGRGIVALLPTEYISAARIRHPNERFRVGQKILAVVKAFDRKNRRITLTHKELLGTWLENASRFSEGDTVRGTVRGDRHCTQQEGLWSFHRTGPQPLRSHRPAGGSARGGRGLRHRPLHPPGAHEDQIAGH